MESGFFVFTSNVDGHFQKAGFPEDKIVECHGSINFLQATQKFNDIWPIPKDLVINVDDLTLSALDPLPSGPPGKYFHSFFNISRDGANYGAGERGGDVGEGVVMWGKGWW